jgi:hypothetical protein
VRQRRRDKKGERSEARVDYHLTGAWRRLGGAAPAPAPATTGEGWFSSSGGALC